MDVTRMHGPSRRGPAEWFTGEVCMDHLAARPEPSRLNAVLVHFAPGARSWSHAHPRGQVLHVTAGLGMVQTRGEAPCLARPGDTVVFTPGEEHWHGAAPAHSMSHLAFHENGDDGIATRWGPQVTDVQYAEASEG